jgi:hypothetical protein
MDLVPGQWLHLTTRAIGFTDKVSDGDVAAIGDVWGTGRAPGRGGWWSRQSPMGVGGLRHRAAWRLS